ncbi:MAG: iron-regulated ABC transporter permease protein SufD [halophilic archaeon J07HX64]|jgi:Iron-regulated ABC transporter permease protein SufD|nr:MAG: iron-regulated ABC transporter permease protein SufD [halophilic archaeon J07HX64]
MSTQVHANLTEEQVREISSDLDEPEWLLQQRLDALNALDDLEMPKVIRTPGRDWTNLDALEFDRFVDPLDRAQEKDRVDAEGVEVLGWAEALDEHGDLVEEQFGSVVDPQRDYLTALSTALFSAGTVIYVPEGVVAEDVKVRTRMNSRSLFNYTLVVAEKSSSVAILERQSTGEESVAPAQQNGEFDGTEGRRYYSGVVEAVAGENAHIQYGALQNLTEDTYNYQVKRGHAGTYGQVNWIEGNIGTRLTKSSVETRLLGEGSESKIVGAFFGHEDQHFDVASRVWHEAEHTTADLVTRGVLDDEARSVYEGVQDVGDSAWSTNSYQRENTLMLSDESEADASPKLIINNHDTEASHSATVGQVDDEDLLYMVSRGIDEEEATDMLVEGFFVPVLEEVAVDELRDDLETLVSERLE